jgi:hypothetical protein
MSQKRIVVVLGMHRSGTSAIARGLKVLNVDLGDNLMPGAPGENEKGFWEDLDVYRLNEKLLAKMGSAWDQLRRIDVAPLCREEFAEDRFEASALIERKMRSSSVFGFKDPRTTILLPFWQCVFEDLGLKESYVIAVRNPLEVCESLRKRNGLEPSFSMALWLKYTWSAVEHSDGQQRVCVSYSNLLAEPAKELARIAAATGLPSATASSPAMIEFVSEFLSTELRHNRISDLEMRRSEKIPAATQALYSALIESAENDAQLDISSKLKTHIEHYLTACGPLLGLGDTLKNKVERSEADRLKEAAGRERAEGIARTQGMRLEELSTESQRLESEIASIKSKAAEHELKMEAVMHAATLAQDQLKDVREQRDRATLELGHKEEQIKRLKEEAEALLSLTSSLGTERENLRSTLAQRDKQVEALSVSDSKANANVAELAGRLHERDLQIEALKLSETAARSDLRDVRLQIENAGQTLSEKDFKIAQLTASLEAYQKAAAARAGETERLTQLSVSQSEKLRQLEALEAETAVVRAEASDLRSLLETARNELKAREQHIEEIETRGERDLATVRAQLESEKLRQLEKLEAETAVAKAESSNLQSLLETARNELKAREQHIEETEARGERDLATVRAQLESVRQSLADRSEKLVVFEAKNIQLASDLQERTKNLRLARGELASLQAELNARGQQIDHLSSELESCARISAEREAEIQRLSSSSEAAHLTIRALEASEASSQSRIADLSWQLEKAFTDTGHHQRVIAQADDRLRALEELRLRNIEELTSKLAGAERILAEADGGRRDGELALVNITAQLHSLQAETTEKTKELRLVRHEVLALRTSTSWRVTKPLRSLRTLLTRPRQVFIRLIKRGE